MKKCVLLAGIGCLFLMTSLAQAQVDKFFDRFMRGDSRIRPGDLRVLQLEVTPDPIQEGQWMSIRVTIANNSSYSGRISLVVRDQDQIVSEARDVNIVPGENQIDFRETYYRFSRPDPCFTVEAVIGQTTRKVDADTEFCARRTRQGWTLSGRGAGRIVVEDLDFYPDPVIPGQDIRFRVKLRNDGRPIRGTIRIQDRDQVVVQVDNVSIPRGYSDFQFPYTRYVFQRSDHCFTVLIDSERTPYPVDAAREFCAKPTGWTLKP